LERVQEEANIMTTAVEVPAQAAASAVEKPNLTPVGWEPNVIAFACHYCAFAAADLAGVMRLSYPPNVKVIRLPCTGKLDHMHVLRAFEKGVDGVFVAG
jgi:F420-non-reducing hydrogenase iron-sulfur subunit